MNATYCKLNFNVQTKPINLKIVKQIQRNATIEFVYRSVLSENFIRAVC